MKIRIIFDKDTGRRGLNTGWGVSFLIGDSVLFDTGEKGEWLLDNMENLGVNIKKIKRIVISHDHWDHTGGLWELLKKTGGVSVYSCRGFSEEFKDRVRKLGAELIESDTVNEIESGVFVTGQIKGRYKEEYIFEQALVMKTDNGLTIATGCSHPGIVKIIEKVKGDFPGDKIWMVFGGFHLMNKERREIKLIVDNFIKMDVVNAGPTHCTGYDAQEEFKRVYKDKYIAIKVGDTIEV